MYRTVLKMFIKHGCLVLKFSNGEIERFGTADTEIVWLLKSRQTIWRIFSNWEYQLGETYVNGEWDVEGGKIFALLCLLRTNFKMPNTLWGARLSAVLLKLQQGRNSIRASKSNVGHHYDLDSSLFRYFLDEEMNYSCAYYESPDVGLEEAQRAKCAHVCKKLQLSAGLSVLDVGSGWGSMALYMAKNYGVKVTGLTLSIEQLQAATRKVKSAGVDHLVKFKLEDYRQHEGQYDRIVSIGMFEHVGRRNFFQYFKTIDDLLTEQGVALVHTIGRTAFPRKTNSWIRKYIFPGGYLPAVSEVCRVVEKTKLKTADLEVLRRHYEMTVREWRNRFITNRQRFVDLKGERFTRILEFYLNVCEAAFRLTDISVLQFQMIKQKDALPITRDNLYTKTHDHL